MSEQFIQLDVVSLEGSVFSGAVLFVVLPGKEGEIGVYPCHTPLMAKISPGLVRFRRPADELEEESIFVAGGVLEVQPNKVTVLADTALRSVDLDEEKAEQARALAEQEIINYRSGKYNEGVEVDYAKAKGELSVALAQIAALRQFAKKRKGTLS